MPRRKPTRSERRRGARPAAPRPAPAPAARAPTPPVVAQPTSSPEAARPPAEARERGAARFTGRDYAYVRREVQRIAVLAAAIIITIVVLSFFLP